MPPIKDRDTGRNTLGRGRSADTGKRGPTGTRQKGHGSRGQAETPLEHPTRKWRQSRGGGSRRGDKHTTTRASTTRRNEKTPSENPETQQNLCMITQHHFTVAEAFVTLMRPSAVTPPLCTHSATRVIPPGTHHCQVASFPLFTARSCPASPPNLGSPGLLLLTNPGCTGYSRGA